MSLPFSKHPLLVSANETIHSFSDYEEKLNNINKELGTDYVMVPSNDFTQDQMESFYCSMTMEKFEQYILSAYEAEKEFDEILRSSTQAIQNSSYSSDTTLQE